MDLETDQDSNRKMRDGPADGNDAALWPAPKAKADRFQFSLLNLLVFTIVVGFFMALAFSGNGYLKVLGVLGLCAMVARVYMLLAP